MKPPKCRACANTARHRVRFWDATEQYRIADLCGRHSAAFRMQRQCASWIVDSVNDLHYVGFTG